MYDVTESVCIRMSHDFPGKLEKLHRILHGSIQGAIEIWEYSALQMQLYRETPGFQSSSITFRHVPFSWFSMVSFDT